jgi:hypothetical protein
VPAVEQVSDRPGSPVSVIARNTHLAAARSSVAPSE